MPKTDSLPLSEAELDAWLAFLTSSQLLISELDRRLRNEVGIPHAWYVLLSVLAAQPDRSYRQSDLASIADFSLSRLSHAINRLEEKGWVRRQPHPSDGRTTNVVLTDAGADAIAAATPRHAAAIRELFLTQLQPAQLAQLKDACTALMPGLPGAPARLLHDIDEPPTN